jgi:mono/diheme cytochrome c family protein
MKYINMISLRNSFILFSSALVLTSCNHDFSWIAEHDKPRVEYATNMYHSIAYEPLTQIIDEDAGSWASSDSKMDTLGYGEYYNSNPLNATSANKFTPINSREPVKGTIKRGFMPYHLGKDSLELAAATISNPLVINDAVLADGKLLYSKFCQHCHGEGGAGDGPVNDALKGVANLTNDVSKGFTPGHIFHVITWGKGRMGAHASQLNQEERWKIVAYVKQNLQK